MNKKSRNYHRKNLLLDHKKLAKLKDKLKTKSESETVRLAIERTLNAENAIISLRNLKDRGTFASNIDK